MRLHRALPYVSIGAAAVIFWIAALFEPEAPPSLFEMQSWEEEIDAQDGPAPLLVSGRLAESGGAPLAGALIAITDGPALVFDHTGDDGRFELRTHDREFGWPNELALDVLAEGFRPTTLRVAQGARSIELRLDQRWDPAPELGAFTAHAVELRLIGLSPAGYDGCELVLWPREAIESAEDPTPTTLRRAPVGADGRVRLERVVPGPYRLLVLPRWAVGGSWPNLLAALDQSAPELVVPADLPENGSLDLSVAAVSAHGTVSTLEDGVPRPIEGATILLSTRLGGRQRHWPLAQSDALGNFALPDLCPGRYRLRVQVGRRSLERDLEAVAGRPVELGRLLIETAGDG